MCVYSDIIIQVKRKVDTVSDLYPAESYELLASAKLIQELLECKWPGVSTTFILKSKSSQFEVS